MNKGTARVKKINCFNNPVSRYVIYVYWGKAGDYRSVDIKFNTDGLFKSYTVTDKNVIVIDEDNNALEYQGVIKYPSEGLYYHKLTVDSSVYCITNLKDDNPILVKYDKIVNNNFALETSEYVFAIGEGSIDHFNVNGVKLLKTNNETIKVTGNMRVISFT